MKYLILLLLPLTSFASEIDVQLLTRSYTTDSDMYQRGQSTGVQVSYIPKDKGYTFISYETVDVLPKGYAFTHKMIGVGAGSKYKLTENISLFGQAGYYFIKNSWGNRKRQINEGLHYYLNDRFIHSNRGDYLNFQEYEVNNDDAIGGTIGVNMNYDLTKSFNVGMVFSYRIMKIKEEVRGYRDAWDYDKTGAAWEFSVVRDYSSINFGLKTDYRF